MRATRIRTVDETILVVPNSALVKERLVNQSRPGRHVTTRVEVAVAYGSDLAQVREILLAAAHGSELVDPQADPVVLVVRFGEHAVQLRLVFWARDYLTQGLASSQVLEAIYRRFAAAGIQIPYPTRRIIQEGAAASSASAEV
jgi:small-conductance mechanosensitive channel